MDINIYFVVIFWVVKIQNVITTFDLLIKMEYIIMECIDSWHFEETVFLGRENRVKLYYLISFHQYLTKYQNSTTEIHIDTQAAEIKQ